MYNIRDSRLIKCLENELKEIRSFETNADKIMHDIKYSYEEEQLVSLARALAFNKRHIKFHLGRAEAMLQLAGYEIETGNLTSNELEFRIIRIGDIRED